MDCDKKFQYNYEPQNVNRDNPSFNLAAVHEVFI